MRLPILLTMLLFALAWNAQPAVAVPLTGAGPGGFEQLGGGASALRLWFAGGNIDGSNNSTLVAGGSVATWVNLAIPGSHNALVGTNNAPIYQPAPALNGNPRVYFDGTVDRELVTDFNIAVTDSYQVFAVADRGVGADPTLGSCCNAIVSAGSGTHRNNVLFLDNPQAAVEGGINAIRYHGHGSASTAANLSTGFNDGNSHILAQQYIRSSNSLTGHFDGVSPGTVNTLATEGSAVGGAFRIGGELNSNARNHRGTISEVIHFNRALNGAELIIVENYLSSKFALPIAGAVDRYAGDAPGIDHDHNVFGVGRVNSTNQALNSGSAGFGIQVTGGVAANELNDGEFILAGHNNVTPSLIDVSPDPEYTGERWSRVWNVDANGGSTDATLGFNFADAGLGAFFDPAASYQLLYSTDQTFATFQDLGLGFTINGNNTVSFNVPANLLINGYFTLGINVGHVPEPNSLLLMLGMLGCGLLRRRKAPVVNQHS